MTDREWELLNYIKKHQPVDWINVLNAFDPVNKVITNDALMKNMLKKRYIKLLNPAAGRLLSKIRMRSFGYMALYKENENRKIPEPNYGELLKELRNEERRIKVTVAAVTICIILGIALFAVLTRH